MSADKVDTLLARIAALEAKLAAQPAPQPAPQTHSGLDPQVLARALAADPVGTMAQLGVPVDHVSRVLVAHTLGDAAPPELRMLAQQGPLVSATQALASDLAAVRQRLESFEKRDQVAARRASFTALAADKTKYPRLSAVMEKNPELFISEVDAFQGNTDALAAEIERRLEATAVALGATPPASTEHAENAPDQSTQVKQAQSGVSGFDPTPPPLSQGKSGVWTQDMHQEAKERVLRKYAPEELAGR
jgi:hypothetical protein